MDEGEKLQAIRLMRELSGLGLEEAKNYIDGTTSCKVKSTFNPIYNTNFKNALRFSDGDLKSKLKGYNNMIIAEIEANEGGAKRNYILEMSLEELDISVGSYNRLKRGGINTIKDLVSKTEDDMMKIRKMHKENLGEVINKLKSLHLTFKQDNGYLSNQVATISVISLGCLVNAKNIELCNRGNNFETNHL